MPPRTSRARQDTDGINSQLPPLHQGLEIFEDLVRQLHGFTGILDWAPLSLNVATVCSGTDSPIFALNLIQEAVRSMGHDVIEFEHKFACEIEAFKQAFIRRNTDQSLIFRDVVELGAPGATRAMVAGGYLADIPADKLDLFVAGCSCVDYSNLNNARSGKTDLPVFDAYNLDTRAGKHASPTQLDGEFVGRLMQSLETLEKSGTGESMRTFLSAMSYIIRARPKLVILENVESAPWAAKTNFWFPRAGYAAVHVKVNSRKFYLPQTRQRGYLVAADAEFFGVDEAQSVVKQSAMFVQMLERQASSPVTEFLLGVDDARLVEARGEMEQRGGGAGAGGGQKDIDWGYSQLRHEATRRESGLAAGAHPFSRAVFSHGRLMEATPPGRSWMQYFGRQPARVLDFIDIVVLRSLQQQCDLRYKTWVLDVSQNVDRSSVFTSSMNGRFGTIGCLTPSGQPILTDQMRPLTGLEALGLQGLPLDDLVLSTETQAQLQDLAGNAMTVPVVGAVMLAALAASHGSLPKRSQPTSIHVDDHTHLAEYPLAEEAYMKGIGPWDLGTFINANLGAAVGLAFRGARLCFCPQPKTPYVECADCNATACQACRGNPQHAFPAATTRLPSDRVSRAELQLQLGGCLPGVFSLQADTATIFKNLSMAEMSSGGAVESRPGADLLFHGSIAFYRGQITVSEVVTVEYQAVQLAARLVLRRSGTADWLLFARRPGDGTHSTDVHVVNQPIARGRLAGPTSQSDNAPAAAATEPGQAPTVDPASADWAVWSGIRCAIGLELHAGIRQIEVLVADGNRLPCGSRPFPAHIRDMIRNDVCGSYRHRPHCGGPEDLLYTQIPTPYATNRYYLFKEVSCTGAPNDDKFVFSDDNRQLEAGEYREVVLRTSETSLPVSGVMKQVTAHMDGYWVLCGRSAFSTSSGAVPSGHFAIGRSDVFTGNNGRQCCETKPATLLSATLEVSSLPLPGSTISRWMRHTGRSAYYSVPPARLDRFLKDISFACSALSKVATEHLAELSVRGRGAQVALCQGCCLPPPKSYWNNPDGSSAARPWEDPDEVERFEKRLKELPPPLAASVAFYDKTETTGCSGTMGFHFTFNARTLPSRALAHLAHIARGAGSSPGSVVLSHAQTFCEVDWRYRPEPGSSTSFAPFPTALRDSSSLAGVVPDGAKTYLGPLGS